MEYYILRKERRKEGTRGMEARIGSEDEGKGDGKDKNMVEKIGIE